VTQADISECPAIELAAKLLGGLVDEHLRRQVLACATIGTRLTDETPHKAGRLTSLRHNPTVLDEYLRRSLLARVYDVALETPLELAPTLSGRVGNQVFLKREDLQPVFSFKLRGAYNKISNLSEEALSRGVITASAGNHAQGVALSAQRLGIRAVIVMPVTTPSIKIDAVMARGGEVVLFGDNFDAAYAHAKQIESAEGMTFVHPYDDPDIIAGQGTIGLEILKQIPARLDAVFIPVGGGGLLAGIGAVIKALRPEVRIIAVEPEDAASMAASLHAGHRVTLDRVGRFADGVAVRLVGEHTFEIAKQVVDETVVVSNDEICGAIKDIFEDRRAIVEPAGALAYAGLKRWVADKEVEGLSLVVIASGANMNFDSLRHVSERAELGEKREAVFAVTIPERPGSFRGFCRIIGARAVTEFNYRYSDSDSAHVFVGVRIGDRGEAEEIADCLRAGGYDALDLTDDETAKLHVRHMVGGRAAGVENERIVSFSFPERAGALTQFLDGMEHPWNISLFHYRNHGSDYGRVLAGIQVPHDESEQFQAFLDRTGYEYSEETDNPACRLFLK
jgi:threonine dehydratase